MRIDIISAVPQLFDDFFYKSIVGNAVSKGLVDIKIHDLHDYSEDPHNKVDDYPYGGGGGMVLTPQPVFSCVRKLQKHRIYDEIIYTSPAGKQFDQDIANSISLKENIIILCGHYKGVDHRVRKALVTKEISLGDFVLSGGEIPAMAITDAAVRLIPGVLGDAQSALTDSFQDGLLEGEIYTRPQEYESMKVPEVLLSGDHSKIENWRHRKSIERTKKLRPDLFKQFIENH